MFKKNHNHIFLNIRVVILLLVTFLFATQILFSQKITNDTLITKSGKKPRYIFKKSSSLFNKRKINSPFAYDQLKGEKTEVTLLNDNTITQTSKMGNFELKDSRSLSFNEFSQQQNQQINRSFWNNYSKSLDGNSSMKSRGLFPKIELPASMDRIFGGSEITFKPNGSLLLDVGYMGQFVDNPAIPVQLRYVGNLYFNEQAQLNFQGKIGDKLNLNTNFDTKASFNFQNQLKLNWKTQEEDILQSIEAGNTSWTLNSQLIPGVQNLFGLKTLMRFGNLDVTLVAAQQRSKQDCITLRGGSQGRSFEIRADQYDENRHFFLSTFFRNNYEKALKNLPVITSGITITRLEVYVTNRTQNTETLRNLVALSDLGERLPARTEPANNDNNLLYKNITSDVNIRKANEAANLLETQYSLKRGTDYDILKGAKRLNEREFKFNAQLGYISLVAPLRNDEVLAVSYEYTLNGRKYKVGEMTEDYQARQDDEILVLKMLKSSTIRNHLDHPMWDLMMKNIYSLNTTSLSKQNFQFKIVYKDDATGIDNSNIIEGVKKNIPYVSALGLDKLNFAGDPQPDGNFDFVEDVTVDPKNGKIIFPVLEPFGKTLKQNIFTTPDLQSKYIFEELYTKTQSDAVQLASKNKFFLKGSYQAGSGGDISLPFGVDPKSVTVTAGGQSLSLGTDFIIEGQSGRVRIVNESIFSSGRELKVCYEKPDIFSNQVRTLLGTRLDYNLSPDVHLGATVQSMSETPPAFFRRVAIGNEPVNNTLIGLDAAFTKKSNGITRFLDKLPLISTKESSAIDFQGEVAKLFPNVNDRVQGNAFIDDFEAARVIYNMSSQATLWKPGATPHSMLNGIPSIKLESNYKRAKISAYTVDASIYGQGNFAFSVPGLDPNEVNSYAYERVVTPKGLFPNKDFANNITNLPIGVLDVAYFPSERGLYNFNPNLNTLGLFDKPEENFGAITRAITSDTDFDNSNVEQLEFWLMDPFIDKTKGGTIRDGIINGSNTTGGVLKFHLGDVSEDFIPDGFSNFENGIPASEKITDGSKKNVESTVWGIAPKRQFVINAFDNQGGRSVQDIGLDGLPNKTTDGTLLSEESYFKDYLSSVSGKVTNSNALQAIKNDPAGDDFVYYLNEKFNSTGSVIERYKNFMGLENNSPTTDNPTNSNFTQANSITPDREDLNNDNTINEVESYFEYEIPLKPKDLAIGKGFVVDKINEGGVDWYLMRIPIKDAKNYKAVNGISNFKSIRFFRMVLSEFKQPVVLRFAQLQLSGYSYRKFIGDLDVKNGQEAPQKNPETKFTVSSVNIEENGPAGGKSIPYVVPPGFVRDQDITTINNARLNEQSMSLCVDNLRAGDARAVFKNTLFDFINYKRLKMFVSMQSSDAISGQVSAFLRIGTDLTDNYYEIENTGLVQTQKGQSLDTEIWPFENELD
ncbi:MAG: cell surface protein SprA, partial [Aquirufa sp.]